MKIQWKVKMLLGMSACLMTSALAFYTPTTLYYGHGKYYCYYLNRHTRKFYEGVGDKKQEAKEKAHDTCKPSILKDRLDCEFAACRFR